MNDATVTRREHNTLIDLRVRLNSRMPFTRYARWILSSVSVEASFGEHFACESFYA